MKEKSQENHTTGGAECQTEKGRKSKEVLTQQQKLIFKTDFNQYNSSSI